VAAKMEAERRRQEANKVEKELIKTREALETKGREIMVMQEQIHKLS